MTRSILAGLALASSCLVACQTALPAVGPAASCVASVVEDAVAGDTIAQIVTKAGPGCVTDAEEVVAILFGTADERVPATEAYKEAVAVRASKAAKRATNLVDISDEIVSAVTQ